MNMVYIRNFVNTAQYTTFSEAADSLFLSQSTLSKHMQALERYLGVSLFDRTKRKVVLTKDGEVFLTYAKEIYEIEQQYLKLYSEKKQKTSNTLKIGYSYSMSQYGVLKNIRDFSNAYPAIKAEMHEHNGSAILDLLSENYLDISFCDFSLIEDKTERFTYIDYCTDNLVAVVNKSSELSTQNIINASSLANESFIIADTTSTLHKQIYDLCADAGFIPNVHFKGKNIENLLELVHLNMGITIMAEKLALKKINNYNVEIKHILPTTTRSTVLACKKSNEKNKNIALFLEYVSKATKTEKEAM